MPSSPILFDQRPRRGRRQDLDPRAGWTALVTLSIALLLVSATDLGLAFYPFSFGNPEWRFSVLASAASGLPMLTVGALLLLIVSLRRSRGWLLMAVGLNLGILALILAGFWGFLSAAGAAFKSAAPEVHLGLQKAMVKSVSVFLISGAAHGIGGLAGAWDLRRRRNVESAPQSAEAQ